MKNNKKEIQDELEKLAPSLSKLKKEEVSDVPENYFSQLPEQILNQIDFSENKTIAETVSISRSSSWLDQLTERLAIFFQPKMAVGFALMIMLGVASVFTLNDRSRSDTRVADLTSNELENYVKANIDDFEVQELLNLLGNEEEVSWTEVEIGEEYLEEYLEEIIDDLDASDLEDFL
ncbi:MAG: hypothetical protein ACJAT4_002813 [Granulosicoccus sp.]|jgi:hypothetical protein